MKQFILSISCMLTICGISFAQVDSKEVSIVNDSYSVVINGDLPIATKIVNAKEWIAKTFGDYKSVLQFEDESSGKIIIKGKSGFKRERKNLPGGQYNLEDHTATMNYTVTLDFKEDRFRIKFEDIAFDVLQETLIGTSLSKRNKQYSFEEYVQAVDWPTGSISALQEEVEELKAKDESTMSKKDIKNHHEELARKEESLMKKKNDVEWVEGIRMKRSNDVLFTIANFVNSLASSINTNDDF